MFEKLLVLMKELYDGPAAPDSWEEVVYKKAIEGGCSEDEATDLATAATVIANVFAVEMLAKLDAE